MSPRIPRTSTVGSFSAFDQPLSANLSGILTTLTDNGDGTFTTVSGITTTGLAFPAGATLRAVAIESYLSINGMNISGDTAFDITVAQVPEPASPLLLATVVRPR